MSQRHLRSSMSTRLHIRMTMSARLHLRTTLSGQLHLRTTMPARQAMARKFEIRHPKSDLEKESRTCPLKQRIKHRLKVRKRKSQMMISLPLKPKTCCSQDPGEGASQPKGNDMEGRVGHHDPLQSHLDIVDFFLIYGGPSRLSRPSTVSLGWPAPPA